jgi:hypothetical protein
VFDSSHSQASEKPRRRARWTLSICLAGLIATALAAGCGRDTYEHRLDDSRRYFTYLNRLNDNLAPQWSGNGVRMRVPKQFKVLPPPVPKAKKKETAKDSAKKDTKDAAKDSGKDAPQEEENPEEERDPRQPKYADLTFPGLQGAFSTELSVGGKAHEPGYLYVLTNGDLLGKKGSDEKAAGFNNNVLHVIAQAVGQPDPAPEKLASDTVPKGEPWTAKRTFKVVKPGFAAGIEGKDYRIDVYNCKQEKNQVSLVYVLPENVSPTEKLGTNIDLSLETLQVTKVAPMARSAAGGKGTTGQGL